MTVARIGSREMIERLVGFDTTSRLTNLPLIEFVRDYLDTLDWDKQAPGPSLPDAIITRTAEKYREALTLLTGPAYRSTARTAIFIPGLRVITTGTAIKNLAQVLGEITILPE